MESFPSQSIQEKEQSLREEILNRIYIEKSYIFEFYSTNDLIRIMQYTEYNLDKINFLLESYTKEDLLKKIEEHLLLKKKQMQNINSSITQVKKVPKQKHILYSKFVSTINSNQKRNVLISAWNFLNNGGNIIDLKDAIRSLDKMKIISKLKQQKSNKGVSINDVAFNREFFKKIEQKEKKYITYYQQCFEDNDINFIEHTDHFDEKILHGPIHLQLQEALDYIRSQVIVEKVVKVDDKAEANRAYNYPYTAIEEVLSNAVYHKSYDDRNPIEVR